MFDWQVARPFLKLMFPRLAVFPGSQVESIFVHLSGFVCFAGLCPWLEVLTTTCVRTNWRGDFSAKWNKGSKTKIVSKKRKWKTNLRKCMTVIDTRLYFSHQKSEISMESVWLKIFFLYLQWTPPWPFFCHNFRYLIWKYICIPFEIDRMVKG